MADLPVGIWIRVSTQLQVHDESPAHHEFRARAYAQIQGWNVVAMYDLAGVSGKDILAHPETHRMLEDIRTGRIKALIFSKLARLARNTTQLLHIAEIFREHDASLISLSESIDTSTPAGRFFFTLLSAMANWEREEIAARVSDSVSARAKLGKSVGGYAPYGYRWTDGQLELHPAEAPVRRAMYELFLTHRRIQTVARILNDQGHRTREGKPFAKSSMALMLRDPVAKGTRRMNYTQFHGQNKRWSYKPESDWIYVPAPALIDATTWDACQAILTESALKNKRKGRQPQHVFSGLLACASCGLKMYIQHNGTSYICRSCHRKTTDARMEPFLLEQISAFLAEGKEAKAAERESREAMQRHHGQSQALETRQLAIRQEQDALHRLFREGHLSGIEFQERNTPLYESAQTLRAQREAINAEMILLQNSLQMASSMLQQLAGFVGQWRSMDLLGRRASLESLVDRITLGDEQTEIRLDLHHKTLDACMLNAKKQCNRAVAAFISPLRKAICLLVIRSFAAVLGVQTSGVVTTN